jgi:hypothetical protein
MVCLEVEETREYRGEGDEMGEEGRRMVIHYSWLNVLKIK